MDFTPESIVVNASIYTGIGILTGIKYALKKRGATIQALILGSGAGKSTLCKTWNDIYKDERYYFLDLEHMMEHDAKLPKAVLKELQTLKKNDTILYTARILKFYKALLTDILPTLKKLNKTIVIVLSNRNIAKFLNIKQRHYITSDRKMYKEQYDKSEFKEYLTYCRMSMKADKCELYSNYDDLMKKVQEKFGIIDKL